MEAVNGSSLGEDKGGPPPPSPLTGCYLLVVIGEPHSEEHKDIILQKVAKGLLSWDVNECLVDLEKELAIIIEQGMEGEEARYGERLIQFASENLVTEILIHPALSTLSQCVRNLLSSFTRHRHIIHAGYTFQGNGSWALQDGTFSYSDFAEAFQEIEVQRVIHAYENGISIDLHCAPEGDWTRLSKEYFTKACKVRVNPTDVLTTGSPSISSFIKYLDPFLVPTALEDILESSDVVGNIRFSRPTLYVFPGGQGDAALFGINGFNMLLDGGYSRKACFWDFVRHLDRLDAVLMTRLNNSSVSGVSSVLKRKKQGAVYPQIGHFFCNIQERKLLLSPDGDKDKDPLIVSLLEEGQNIIQDLRHLNLNPQSCYRDQEPIILYHKVGHGTLNMYVLSPDKNSREVKEFLQKWNQSDPKLFAVSKTGKDFTFPLQNMVSICALLVWQPANPNDTITRILYPGSTPQKKIFEGLERIKNLEYMKHPVCSVKSIAPAKKPKSDVIEKLTVKETKLMTDKKIEDALKNGEMNGDVVREKHVKKSDSVESDKEKKARIDDGKKPEKADETKIAENGEKPRAKPKMEESKPKTRSDNQQQQQQRRKPTAEKRGPPTPKKTAENKTNGEARERRAPHKASPHATPAKSTKDANNRKVIESKRAPSKKEATPKPAPSTEAKPKTERKPISRRPKTVKGPPSPMKKMTNGIQKIDSLPKRGKLDKEGTTDSSTVSTPSADQESILKKDISKLTPDEIQHLKEKELEELKEEQEAVKEIEAVFRKGEAQTEASEPGVRKIKEMSMDDNLDTEEYLIIEKEEIEHDSLDQEAKEDEMQKLVRDSEESEKQRKLSAEEEKLKADVQEKKAPEPDDETTATKISEPQIVSPEDKPISTTDKKEMAEEDVKEIVESHPEEKVSANIESGATTTAPTLPEDERITLDEIKEDNGQVIEEKHVKEETKEKEVPIIQLPPKSQQDVQLKQPQVVGIPLEKQKHIRDIVKTPDEVADLPVHEEADYHEYHGDEKKSNEVEAKDDKKEKKDEIAVKVVEKVAEDAKDAAETKDVEIDKKVAAEEKPAATKTDEILEKADVETKEKPDQEDHYLQEGKLKESIDEEWVVITKEDEDKAPSKKADEATPQPPKDDDKMIHDEFEVVPAKAEEKPQPSQVDKKDEPVTLPEKAGEATKIIANAPSPSKDDEKKIHDEFEVIQTKEEEKIEEKPQQPQVDKKDEPITPPKSLEEPKADKDIDTESEQDIHEIRKEDEIEEIIEKDKEDIKALIEEADRKPIEDLIIEKEDSKEPPKALDDKVVAIKESKQEIAAIDNKLQQLKKDVTIPVEELKLDKTKDDLTKIEEPPKVDLKQELQQITKIEDKLTELKEETLAKKDEITVETSTRSPEHAESVVLSDSSPEEDSSRILKDLDIDKSELGRKSPAEREEDVKKIVASVAVVLKSEAPLEEFQSKLSFTQELRETHITTQDSPILEAKIIKTDDIPPIPEEPAEEDSKPTVTDKEPTEAEESPEKEDDAGTVHRMLVTASSEDGGEEIEICPAGTITFSKSSESSGRSSPEPSQKTQSQKSSIVDTLSETLSTVKRVSEEDSVIESKVSDDQVDKRVEIAKEEAEKAERDVAKGKEESAKADDKALVGAKIEPTDKAEAEDAKTKDDFKEKVTEDVKEDSAKKLDDKIKETVTTAKHEDVKKESKQKPVEDEATEKIEAEKLKDETVGKLIEEKPAEKSLKDEDAIKKLVKEEKDEDEAKKIPEKVEESPKTAPVVEIEDSTKVQQDEPTKDQKVSEKTEGSPEIVTDVTVEDHKEAPKAVADIVISDQKESEKTEDTSKPTADLELKVEEIAKKDLLEDQKKHVEDKVASEKAEDVSKDLTIKDGATEKPVEETMPPKEAKAEITGKPSEAKFVLEDQILPDKIEEALKRTTDLSEEVALLGKPIEDKTVTDPKASERIEHIPEAPTDLDAKVISKEGAAEAAEVKVDSKVEERSEEIEVPSKTKEELAEKPVEDESVSSKIEEVSKTPIDLAVKAGEKAPSEKIEEIIEKPSEALTIEEAKIAPEYQKDVPSLPTDLKIKDEALVKPCEEKVEETIEKPSEADQKVPEKTEDALRAVPTESLTKDESVVKSVEAAEPSKDISEAKDLKTEEIELVSEDKKAAEKADKLSELFKMESDYQKSSEKLEEVPKAHKDEAEKPSGDKVEAIEEDKLAEDKVVTDKFGDLSEVPKDESIKKPAEDKILTEDLKASEKIEVDTKTQTEPVTKVVLPEKPTEDQEALEKLAEDELVKKPTEDKKISGKVEDVSKASAVEIVGEKLADDQKVSEKIEDVSKLSAKPVEDGALLEDQEASEKLTEDELVKKPTEDQKISEKVEDVSKASTIATVEEKVAEDQKTLEKIEDVSMVPVKPVEDGAILKDQEASEKETKDELVKKPEEDQKASEKTEGVSKLPEKPVEDGALLKDQEASEKETKDELFKKPEEDQKGSEKTEGVSKLPKKPVEDRTHLKDQEAPEKLAEDELIKKPTEDQKASEKIDDVFKAPTVSTDRGKLVEDQKALEETEDVSKELSEKPAEDEALLKDQEASETVIEDKSAEKPTEGKKASEKTEEVSKEPTKEPTPEKTAEFVEKPIEDKAMLDQKASEKATESAVKTEDKIVAEDSEPEKPSNGEFTDKHELDEKKPSELKPLLETEKGSEKPEEVSKTTVQDEATEKPTGAEAKAGFEEHEAAATEKVDEQKSKDEAEKLQEDLGKPDTPESTSEISSIVKEDLRKDDAVSEKPLETSAPAQKDISKITVDEKTEETVPAATKDSEKTFGEKKLDAVESRAGATHIEGAEAEKVLEIEKSQTTAKIPESSEGTSLVGPGDQKVSVIEKIETVEKLSESAEGAAPIEAEERLVKDKTISATEKVDEKTPIEDKKDAPEQIPESFDGKEAPTTEKDVKKDERVPELSKDESKVEAKDKDESFEQVVEDKVGFIVEKESETAKPAEIEDKSLEKPSEIEKLQDVVKRPSEGEDKEDLQKSETVENEALPTEVKASPAEHQPEKITGEQLYKPVEAKAVSEDSKKATETDAKSPLPEVKKEGEPIAGKSVEVSRTEADAAKTEDKLSEIDTKKDEQPKRRDSIIDKAQEFVEKSEEALQDVLTSIGSKAHSVLDEIIKKEPDSEVAGSGKYSPEPSEFEEGRDKKERRGSVIEAAEEFIDKSEKAVESVFTAIEGAAKSVLDSIWADDDDKATGNEKVSRKAEEQDQSSDEFKVDKDTIEKEKKQIDEETDQLRRGYEDLSKLTESVSFEKCHPPEDYKVDKETIGKEEKEIEEKVMHVSESVEKVSDLAESITFDKCHLLDKKEAKIEEEFKLDPEILKKEEKQIEEEADALKRSYEDLSKLTESASFEKCHPPKEYKVDKQIIQKEEKAMEARARHLSESFDEVSQLAKTVSFEKCHPPEEREAGQSGEYKVDKDAAEQEKKLVLDVGKEVIESAGKEIDEEKAARIKEEMEAHVAHVSDRAEEISELAKSLAFEKCPPPSQELKPDSKTDEACASPKSTASSGEFKVDRDAAEKEKEHSDEKLSDKQETETKHDDVEKDISKIKEGPSLACGDATIDSNRLEHLSRDMQEDVKIECKETATKDSAALDHHALPSQTEKCEKESMEKTSCPIKDLASLKVDHADQKKISISDVEISIKTDIDHKDAIQSFLDNERSVVCDTTDAKVFRPSPEDLAASRDGASTVVLKTPSDAGASSDKSSPEVELSGQATPPTVPISPVAKDVKSPSSKHDSGLSEQTETDEEDLSTKSQIAHSQSDLDELDAKMDPMSMSFYGALPEEQPEPKEVAPTYLYEITKAKYGSDIKIDEEEGAMKEDEMNLMTASFIGALPSSSSTSRTTQDKPQDAVDTWGKPLSLPAPTYLHEVTQTRFSTKPDEVDLMTSSFIGEQLPTSSQLEQKEQDPMTTSVYFGDSSDPIASWGKPLGLPSPAPPNNNEKGTPKKEKKLPAYVSAKNKLNDDKKRAESPSKMRAKKVNPVYVDLTYVPHHGNHNYCYVDFFKKIRARYYVFSGLEPSRQVYDALLEAKQTWEDKELEVTIIPTYDTDILGYWVAENEELLSRFKIDLAPSASRCTINLQDHETSCSAYRLEF